MLVWAEQMFNCFGPLNDRARGAFPVLQEMTHYATTQAVRGKLKPGSWAEAIIDAVDRGVPLSPGQHVLFEVLHQPLLHQIAYARLVASAPAPSLRVP